MSKITKIDDHTYCEEIDVFLTDFEFKLLKHFHKKRYAHFSVIEEKFEIPSNEKITDILDRLEEYEYLEELTAPELDCIKKNLPIPDNFSSSEMTGYYRITRAGDALVEENKSEQFRFYLPYFTSLILSIISIILSIISLLRTLG